MDADYENVTGVTYERALTEMRIIEQQIDERRGKGFESADEVFKFGLEHNCLYRTYSGSSKANLYVSHQGIVYRTFGSWWELYDDVLFYMDYFDTGPGGQPKRVPVDWRDKKMIITARAGGEEGDGRVGSQPLYYRNLFEPMGYYNKTRGCFNIARPIKIFAKETGADTTFIYEYLQHLCGENYMFVLAWLRQKMIAPMSKTEVVPVFISSTQGTGKSTFATIICKALFDPENVEVTAQYDSSARFNSDTVDKLIVSIEEKMQDDRRNDLSMIKGLVTSTRVRKEMKNVDPYYQESFTEFIITSNSEVPIKFDQEDQRRFMVMEVDGSFTRDNPLAAEVFRSLYGRDPGDHSVKTGPSLIESKETIQQFKHELLTNEVLKDIKPADFVRTKAYRRCFSLPRTNESIDIEMTVTAIAPFLLDTLIHERVSFNVENEDGVQIRLGDIADMDAFAYVRSSGQSPDRVGVNRVLVFIDEHTRKAWAHSVVERGLLAARAMLREKYGLIYMTESDPPQRGYRNVLGKHKFAPTAWFTMDPEQLEKLRYHATESLDERLRKVKTEFRVPEEVAVVTPTVASVRSAPNIVRMERIGQRVRYGNDMRPDPNGPWETVNELKPEATNRQAINAQYLDTFLFEADETSEVNKGLETMRINAASSRGRLLQAEELYRERLAIQDAEAERLFKDGVVARVVYSGAKSLHMLVRVEDMPANLDERKWLFSYLCTNLSDKLTFDANVGDPTRLTRAPVDAHRTTFATEGTKVYGKQRLLCEDWSHVYDINWRPLYNDWATRQPEAYEKMGRMMPAKPIFKDAAVALLDGTFFIADKWNGIRQQCFFPAYRLVRMMGFTEEQVWEEIQKQTKYYYHPGDVHYWRSRRNSPIIRSIEESLADVPLATGLVWGEDEIHKDT